MESWRMLVVPERSLGGFWHNGCTKDTLRKVYIHFYISTCLGIAPSPMCLQRGSSWSLRGRWWFLRGVLMVFDIMDVFYIRQWSYISIFRSLPALELLHLLCVSRGSSWSLRGRWWFLRGVLMVFNILDFPNIHQGSYISIFRSLPSWEVVQLLGSPERHSRSLRGCWWFLRGVLMVFDIMDVFYIHQNEATHQFSDLYLHGKSSNC